MKMLLTISLILIFNTYGLSQSLYVDGKIENEINGYELENWQIEIAKKDNKNIVDYYLILPRKLLEVETLIENDSKEYRLLKANNERHPMQGRINIKAGYLIASPDVYLKMALFKDRKNKKDIIGIVLGCGIPPVQYCDFGFLEFNSEKLRWKYNKDVFPWEEFNEKCKNVELKKVSGKECFSPNLILPEFGTTIITIDAWDQNEMPVFKINWNGEKFEIQ